MSSSHSSSTSPKRRSTRRSKSASRASQNKRTSQEKRASRENRTVKKAKNWFRELPLRTLFKKKKYSDSNNEEYSDFNNEELSASDMIAKADRRSKKGAIQMSKKIVVEGDIDAYIRPLVPIIRKQLHEVTTIIFALYTYTNHPIQWKYTDIPTLERVKQTLMNALYSIIYTEQKYPKEQYPRLHNYPQPATDITNEEYKKVALFYTPIKKVIKEQLLKIFKAGSAYLDKPHGAPLRKKIELLLDMFVRFPPYKREIDFMKTNGSILYHDLE